jgi:hypothetical protein
LSTLKAATDTPKAATTLRLPPISARKAAKVRKWQP